MGGEPYPEIRPAGPLAYKLDTLIINRRIEEAARPIPRIIRLGSLQEICRELGQIDEGKNTNQIKNALSSKCICCDHCEDSLPAERWDRTHAGSRFQSLSASSSRARSCPTAARPMPCISFSTIFTCRSSMGR